MKSRHFNEGVLVLEGTVKINGREGARGVEGFFELAGIKGTKKF